MRGNPCEMTFLYTHTRQNSTKLDWNISESENWKKKCGSVKKPHLSSVEAYKNKWYHTAFQNWWHLEVFSQEAVLWCCKDKSQMIVGRVAVAAASGIWCTNARHGRSLIWGSTGGLIMFSVGWASHLGWNLLMVEEVSWLWIVSSTIQNYDVM